MWFPGLTIHPQLIIIRQYNNKSANRLNVCPVSVPTFTQCAGETGKEAGGGVQEIQQRSTRIDESTGFMAMKCYTRSIRPHHPIRQDLPLDYSESLFWLPAMPTSAHNKDRLRQRTLAKMSSEVVVQPSEYPYSWKLDFITAGANQWRCLWLWWPIKCVLECRRVKYREFNGGSSHTEFISGIFTITFCTFFRSLLVTHVNSSFLAPQEEHNHLMTDVKNIIIYANHIC